MSRKSPIDMAAHLEVSRRVTRSQSKNEMLKKIICTDSKVVESVFVPSKESTDYSRLDTGPHLKRKSRILRTEEKSQKKQKSNSEHEKRNQNVKGENEKVIACAGFHMQNLEPFECPICFLQIPGGEGVVLQQCLHKFCRPCLASTVEHSQTALIKCPFRDDDFNCENHLEEMQIKQLVTTEVYNRHLQRHIILTTSNTEYSLHCKTADCQGYCFYDSNVRVFHCQLCGHFNCISCDAIHEGKSCEQYQKEVALGLTTNAKEKETIKQIQDMIREGDLMLCPMCKAILKKEGVCDGLMCFMCRTEICWATKGPRWGPKGNGDISGGCRCNVDVEAEANESCKEHKRNRRNEELNQIAKSDYECLIELADYLVPNSEPFDCPVCQTHVVPGGGVVLHECLHSLCRYCVIFAVQTSEDAVVRCPFTIGDITCEGHLQELEIRALVTPETYEEHLQRSIFVAEKSAENSFHCKTEGCPGWCLFEPGVLTFQCYVCSKFNCLQCKAIHEGQSCEQFKEVELISRTNVVKNDYEQLLELSQSLLRNWESFECPICFVDIAEGEGVVLQECLHNFCRPCLSATIQHSNALCIRCPFLSDNSNCQSYLQEMEIKALVSTKLYELHLHRSLTHAECNADNSFHCKTTDCAGWCLFEDGVREFVCSLCGHVNCIACKANHEGKTCEVYQEEAVFRLPKNEQEIKTAEYIENIIKIGIAMKCPKCSAILKKDGGCDGIVCSMCSTEVCWATKGPRWGPKGKGDISGGCRCGVKGKCHPKCRNCH